jgi:hypothetical protein
LFGGGEEEWKSWRNGLELSDELAQQLADGVCSPIRGAGQASLCRLDDGVMVQRIGEGADRMGATTEAVKMRLRSIQPLLT